MNPSDPPEKYAKRLAADQARFRAEQNERTRALGVTINWSLRWDRAVGARQWEWADRTNMNTPVYAAWAADVKENGDIVVTRTEYGYLPAPNEKGEPEDPPSV